MHVICDDVENKFFFFFFFVNCWAVLFTGWMPPCQPTNSIKAMKDVTAAEIYKSIKITF